VPPITNKYFLSKKTNYQTYHRDVKLTFKLVPIQVFIKVEDAINSNTTKKHQTKDHMTTLTRARR
jgi:hypothetical protein